MTPYEQSMTRENKLTTRTTVRVTLCDPSSSDQITTEDE